MQEEFCPPSSVGAYWHLNEEKCRSWFHSDSLELKETLGIKGSMFRRHFHIHTPLDMT